MNHKLFSTIRSALITSGSLALVNTPAFSQASPPETTGQFQENAQAAQAEWQAGAPERQANAQQFQQTVQAGAPQIYEKKQAAPT